MIQESFSTKLSQLREDCTKNEEKNLAFYCDSLRKVYNAYHKIEESELLSYAKQIIEPAFPKIIRYFMERVKACLTTRSEVERAIIRKDVEDSMVEFCEMFDVIIHSTNTVDQILFQTAPLNTGVRYSSPKLCAFYSRVLNQLAGVLVEDEKDKYAFCVYPTLNSKAEAVLLFSTMQQTGKICVIRVPGHQIAYVDKMLLLLFHELYHVLPGEKQRKRKLRAQCYLSVISYHISGMLFEGCNLTEVEENQLVESFFGECYRTQNQNIKKKAANNRELYSRKFQEEILTEYVYCLHDVQRRGIDHYRDLFYKEKKYDTYQEYEADLVKLRSIYDQIQKNCQRMITNNCIVSESQFYMSLFREPFCDILTILTLKLSPEKYFTGLDYHRKIDKDYCNRELLYWRMYLVIRTMTDEYSNASVEQMKLLDEWESWSKDESCPFVNELLNMQSELQYPSSDIQKDKKMSSQDIGKDLQDQVLVIMPNKIIKKYQRYFSCCCDRFLELQREKKYQFDNLREQYGLSYNGKDILLNVISKRKWEFGKSG